MLNIDNNLIKDIEEYCKINNITDIDKEINIILRKGFNIIRFGNSPFERRDMEKPQKIESPKEAVKESKKEEVIEVTPKVEKPLVDPKKEEIPQVIVSSTTVEEVKETKPKRKYTRKVRLLKDE